MFKDAAGSVPRQADDVVRMQMHEVVYNSLDVVEERRTLKAVCQGGGASDCTVERGWPSGQVFGSPSPSPWTAAASLLSWTSHSRVSLDGVFLHFLAPHFLTRQRF